MISSIFWPFPHFESSYLGNSNQNYRENRHTNMFIFKIKINYESETIAYIFVYYQLIIMKRECHKMYIKRTLLNSARCLLQFKYIVVFTKYEYSWNIIFKRYVIAKTYCKQVQTHKSFIHKQYTNIKVIISKALLESEVRIPR